MYNELRLTRAAFNLDQVNYVWAEPWSFGSILFLLNRYSPFIDAFMYIDCKVYRVMLTWTLKY